MTTSTTLEHLVRSLTDLVAGRTCDAEFIAALQHLTQAHLLVTNEEGECTRYNYCRGKRAGLAAGYSGGKNSDGSTYVRYDYEDGSYYTEETRADGNTYVITGNAQGGYASSNLALTFSQTANATIIVHTQGKNAVAELRLEPKPAFGADQNVGPVDEPAMDAVTPVEEIEICPPAEIETQVDPVK